MLNQTSGNRHACIYARVSTAEQEKEGFSIPAQLKMLRGYAKKKGFTVLREFRDNETATAVGRPGFNEMLAFIGKTNSCNTILVEKTDRLTRNMRDYLKIDLENSGIEIHFVREGKVLSSDASPTAHFMQDIEIAQAAYLSRNISFEAKKGMRAKAEAGFYPSVAPLGYLNTQRTDGKKVIIPDAVKAPLVKLMFEMYATGTVSIKDLSAEMFSKGLRTKHGSKLSTSAIFKMLKNPIYRGKFIWNGKEYSGNHESLVSSSLWFRVQDIREGKSNVKHRRDRDFAFGGLLQCGICGCAITAERKLEKYTYYHCTGFRSTHPVKSVREEKLDKQFSRLLDNLRVAPDIADYFLGALRDDTRDQAQTLEMIRERLRSQRSRLEKRSGVLYDDRLDGRITVSVYDEKAAEIRRELELIEEELSSVDETANLDPLSTAEKIIETLQEAPELYLRGDALQKRTLLQNLLSKCSLTHGTIQPEFPYLIGIVHDTNIAWRASGAVSTDNTALHSFWHPVANSNLVILCGKPG